MKRSPSPVRGIQRHAVLCVALLGCWSVLLGGCDDAGKRPVQARVPATNVTPGDPAPTADRTAQQAAAPQSSLGGVALPLTNPIPRPNISLLPVIPDSKTYLAQRVEAKFASGEQNYKAGHLEAARKDFNEAVDWMLESGYDPASSPRLNELFHRLVDTVYSDELQAFRAGDGFSEPPAVPAAIDEVAEMTFPVDPQLKARAEEAAKSISHDLPLTVNDEVLSFLNFFQTTRGRAIVETGLRRSGRYREMIQRVLAEEGVPQDLIYLAQAESAFQPLALSRAGARGIWQFVAWRGNEYGLKHSWWVDDRQDPEKATRAAAHHLRDLYGMFGDWYLAMAAYNCGPGNVQKAVERTGYADFWELYRRNVLPKETKNYVPIILALTLIAKDAAHYGIRVDADPPVPYDVVKPGRAIDLRLVAETIDVDVETLHGLNPSLLRLATPDDPSFELHLPPGTAGRFSSEIADIPPEKWVSWRRHRVEPGETLVSIAKKYKVTPAAIAEANSLERGAGLESGEKLIIPAAQAQREATRRLVSYRVRKGDTFLGIADRFSVEADDLKKWNRLKANKVSRGMVLRIYTLGGAPEAAPHRSSNHATTRKKPRRSGTAAAQASGNSPTHN
ncbi:MAG TPA: transglycosylase SLT domain-containing protein [Candidatus Dormibacteraeota bacterium]|nr:transglycosylase SLT domain-containing protein [Candidatus Dormibacteraeota bacterium]